MNTHTQLTALAREAAELDARDALAERREQFCQPSPRAGKPTVYLCGNSLGLMPKSARTEVDGELDDWSRLGVRGHLESEHPWLPYHRRAATGLATLTGAKPAEVVAMNTLTVNLHLLMVSFYQPDGRRRKILIEKDAFPSDRFAVTSQLKFHGCDPNADLIEWSPPPGDTVLRMEDLAALLERHSDSIALMLLPGVQYLSGQALDMGRLAELARRHEITLGLDLAHAIGNVALELHDWGADFAVWCHYKYVNGGPGAIGGAFVHERHHHDSARPRWLGWWGHEEATRLRMDAHYRPAAGVDRWQISNVPVLSLAPVVASLDIFSEVGMAKLRAKSVRLTGFLERCLKLQFADRIDIATPIDPAARGCQLSLVTAGLGVKGKELFKRLDALNAVIDWREPNVIRVAPAPLYNSYTDVAEFTARMAEAAGEIPDR